MAETLSISSTTKHRLLFGYLSIPESTVSQILPSIQYWATPLRGKTAEGFLARNPRKWYDWSDRFCLDSPEDGRSYSGPVSPTDVYGNHRFEQDLFVKVGVVLPPKKLLDRHPVLGNIVKKNKLTSELETAVIDEVNATWKPNPTAFDVRLHVGCFEAHISPCLLILAIRSLTPMTKRRCQGPSSTDTQRSSLILITGSGPSTESRTDGHSI